MSIEVGDFVKFKFEEQVYSGGKVQKITTQIIGGFNFYDINYQNKKIMTVSELNVEFLKRPKFKVGEWVELNCFAYPKYHGLKANVMNTSISPTATIHYDVNFYKDFFNIEKVNFVKEDLLEKIVNPNVDVKLSNHIRLDKDGFCVTPKPIIKGDKEIVDDILDACRYTMNEETFNYDKYILGVRSGKDQVRLAQIFKELEEFENQFKTLKWIEDRIEKPFIPIEYIINGKPIFQKDLIKTLDDLKYYHFSLDDKKRLPDEVIFKDGKTTLLFSVNNDGKAPYTSYSSKVTKGDTFDKEFGFLITYLKYLNDNYKDVLQDCFDFKGKARLSFLYGVVRQLCENNNIDVADLNNYAIHILNNDRYTLKQYNDWKREIETKAKRYTEVVNEIEAKEKELDKLKKQKENLK